MRYLIIFSTYVKCKLPTDSTDCLQPPLPYDKSLATAQRSLPCAATHILVQSKINCTPPLLDAFRPCSYIVPTGCALEDGKGVVRCCQSSATIKTTLHCLIHHQMCHTYRPRIGRVRLGSSWRGRRWAAYEVHRSHQTALLTLSQPELAPSEIFGELRCRSWAEATKYLWRVVLARAKKEEEAVLSPLRDL